MHAIPINILLARLRDRPRLVSRESTIRRFFNPANRGITIELRSRARENVLDKNAVSLVTNAVFPQRSTATDGDLRRRARSAKGFPSPRELRCIFHGWPSPRRLFSVERQRDFATGIYRRDVALFTISAERLTSTSGVERKKFSLIKNG